MGRNIMQFRYYGEPVGNNTNIESKSYLNYPATLTAEQLISNGSNAFSLYTPILQLGVQGLPGTRFYINEASEPVTIGYSGVYELDIGTQMTIRTLRFDKNSLEVIENTQGAYLIVDILYDSSDISNNANVNVSGSIQASSEEQFVWETL